MERFTRMEVVTKERGYSLVSLWWWRDALVN